MKYELNHIDTCTSDYFSGHHLEVVQIAVLNTTTYSDIKNMLKDFYYAVDHIENIDLDVYAVAVDELFEGITNMNAIPNCCLGIEEHSSDDDYYDDVYMFFSLGRFSADELDDVYVQQIEYARNSVVITKDRLSVTLTDIHDKDNYYYLQDNEFDTFVEKSSKLYNEIACITTDEADMLVAYEYLDLLTQ